MNLRISMLCCLRDEHTTEGLCRLASACMEINVRAANGTEQTKAL